MDSLLRQASLVHNALSGYIKKFSAAIKVTLSEGGYHIGSATCVSIKDRYFLATAGHNFDDVHDDIEQVSIISPNVETINGVSIVSYKAKSAKAGDDVIDVAWAELDYHQAQRDKFEFIDLNSLTINHQLDNTNSYLVTGVPTEKVVRTFDQVTFNFVSYLTSPIIDISSDVDIAFQYENTALSDDGVVAMPYPKGMSGGGIWLVNNNFSDKIWAPSCQLIGVVRSYQRKTNKIYGVQIQHWLDLFKDCVL